jgi:hypothetical protein
MVTWENKTFVNLALRLKISHLVLNFITHLFHKIGCYVHFNLCSSLNG